tara:strand:+ start:176 stop:1192 length:1017 start_codon:yes stop_codon:yes gene_type:complete
MDINYFHINNRRYFGNKHRLRNFISQTLKNEKINLTSFVDIFAGTGAVSDLVNNSCEKIILNDILKSNEIILKTFFEINFPYEKEIIDKIKFLNSIETTDENYFSQNFGGTYFTKSNARKIGLIREEIDNISESEFQKNILLTSLIYAVDKIANTAGHYDSFFRRILDSDLEIKLLLPKINWELNLDNSVYNMDANLLIKDIHCDVLYLDPPYNSRQYSDAYHVLENLVEWEKPDVFGLAKKMDRSHIKSKYNSKDATLSFKELIEAANCNHILLSYNSTKDTKNHRSNARINDKDIIEILENKGKVKVYETEYRAFTAGKSSSKGNKERLFYCRVSE